MNLFVLRFSSMYDNETIGVYSTEESAFNIRDKKIELDRAGYPNHPNRYEQRKDYYFIEEFELDSDKIFM